MINFKSLEEYVQIVKQAQAEGLKNINCYLMPNEILNLISSNQLFYIKTSSCLQVIIKKDRYFKVCWYCNDEFKFEFFETELPILVDLPYSIKMNEKLQCFKEKLESQGFQLNSSTTRMFCPVFDIDYNLNGLRVEEIKSDEIDEVYDIWEDNFDPIQNLLYSKQEIKNCENKIYVLKDNKNAIMGAMEVVLNGNYGWIQHIAIKKEYHGKGFGSLLECFYINKCKSLGIKTLLLYTIDSNLGAQRFHAKFGFKPDGKYNCQFIYRR